VADIHKVKEHADVVVLSMHWGIHFVPIVIAHYQQEIAHAAIDAGVDIVIGHHPHILKGVEIYKGKPVFYSLGNFAIDPPTAFQKGLTSTKSHKEIAALNPHWQVNGEHIRLPDSSLAMAIRCSLADKQIIATSILPVHIDEDSRPRWLLAKDPEFQEIAARLRSISLAEGLQTEFSQRNDQILAVVIN
jgi:poly-gamma-glutamate synthesis protein (capsule biosynthesis protein)